MDIVLIAALADNGVIGKDGDMPWRRDPSMRVFSRADMVRFKQLTMGHPVLMGRKTYESIPKRFRPLKGRPNLVLTRNESYHQPGVFFYNTIDDAIEAAPTLDHFRIGQGVDLYVAGGAQIYEALLSQADRLELTKIHKEFEWDTFFPELDLSRWDLSYSDSQEGFTFETYRIKK